MDLVASKPDQPTWIVRFLAWAREQHLLYPAALWFFLRLWFSVWAAVAAALIPPLAASYNTQYHGMTPLIGSLNQIFWAPWQRWDSIWITKIAEQGYATSDLTTAFFPLYPLLIKITAPLFAGNSVAAGVTLSSVLALLSFILLYRFTRTEFGEPVAQRTLLYFAIFPTAFFLFAAYTESLFLALVLGAFISARTRHWGWAGLLGALAGLTRVQGALLVLPLGVEFLLQYRRGEVSLPCVVNLLLTAVGGAAYWIYLALRFGNLWAGMQIQSAFRQPMAPWDTLATATAQVFGLTGEREGFFGAPDLMITVLFLGLAVWSIWRLSPVWSIYMAIILIPPLTSINTFNPLLPLASMGRYVLMAFPGFILLSLKPHRSIWARLLIVGSFILQAFALILFVAWVFVE